MDDRTGKFHRDLRAGQQMLYRLIAADRFAELVAILCIGYRQVDAALPETDQLRGGEDGAAVGGLPPIAGDFSVGRRRPGYRKQAAKRIDALDPCQIDRVASYQMYRRPVGEQQRIGRVGIRDQGIGRVAHRDDGAADGTFQPTLVVVQSGEQRHRDACKLNQRFRECDIACRLGDSDKVGQCQAKTAKGFRGQHADEAHFGDGRPAHLIAGLASVE